MKHKFSKILGIGLTLALLVSMLVTVAPVGAVATEVTEVWVEFPTADAGGTTATTYNIAGALGLYRIHFKPTAALVRGIDTITIQFPDGVDTTMGPAGSEFAFTVGAGAATAKNFDLDADGPGTAFGYYDDPGSAKTVIDAVYGAKRITLTVGVDIPAGNEVWLMIDDDTDMVRGGDANTSAYKVKLFTSKDTTPVLSKGFYLGDGAAQVGATTVAISPTQAGAADVQYTFEFDPVTALDTGDTITVTFPYGTTLPSTIPASSVTLYNNNGTNWITIGLEPTIDTDLRTVTIVTPSDVAGAGSKVKFDTTAGITNPTKAGTVWGQEDVIALSKAGFLRTNEKPQNRPLDAYSVTYGIATKLAFTSASDGHTMINMYSSELYLKVQDQYGNTVTGGSYATATVVFTKSSGTGALYKYDSAYVVITSEAVTGGTLDIFYKDPTAGTTHTVTATTSGIDPVTRTITVAPAVSLYDMYDNLINTYAASSGTPVEETNQNGSIVDRLGGYYIQQAINAATAYDEVVLGNGTYEVDASNLVEVDKPNITIKSLNGRDYTTIAAKTGLSADIVLITAANVTIDGLTFKGLKATSGAVNGIDARWSGFTIRNNKFVDIYYDSIWVPASGEDVTSGTITNNILIGMGMGSAIDRGGISLETTNGNAMSGVSITNNTLSAYTGHSTHAIGVAYTSGAISDITVQDNTISGSYRGINLWGVVTGMTGTKAISGNTITGNFTGFKASGGVNVEFDLVNNDLSGNTLYGVRLFDATPTGVNKVTIKYNDLSGNGKWGIYNARVATNFDVIAKYNWWGDATGPGGGTGTYASTASGSGDNVSVEVIYEPWLHKSLADVVANNASYPTFKVSLSVGWNTLSVPGKLISGADGLDDLVSSGVSIAYTYSASDGWQDITTNLVINPLDAIYIKMDSAQTVLLKVDGAATSAPTKSLAAGWNLIGLASLTSLASEVATASVYGTSFGQLVSPSLNASEWVFVSTSSPQGTLEIGEGYWIFMKSAATLAGFTILPMAPSLN